MQRSARHRGVSDRGFAKARDHLSKNALQQLNTFMVQAADCLGLNERWQAFAGCCAATRSMARRQCGLCLPAETQEPR